MASLPEASLPESCATTQPQSLAEAFDKELTCAICLSRFESPKVLPCLHLYCEKCLEGMTKKSLDKDKGYVVCPQCQERHTIPKQGIDGFKTYFTINNLLELLHVHEANDDSPKAAAILCESLLDQNIAEARCLDCPCYLCKSCSEMHKKMLFTSSHTVVTLSDIKSSDKKEGVKNFQHAQYCDEHKEEKLKLFCKTCKQVICRDCTIVKCRGHDYVFIRDARPDTQKLLEKLVKDVQAKEIEFVSHLKYLQKVATSDSSSLKLCEKEVNTTFDGLKTAIENRRAVVIGQMHEIYDSKVKRSKIEAESLSLSLRRLQDSIQFTLQLLDNASDVEVMSLSIQATMTLENLKQLAWDEASIKPSLLCFKSDPKLTDSIKEFGAIANKLVPEDIILKDIPVAIDEDETLRFRVELAPEVSQTEYKSPITVKVTHKRLSSEVPCTIAEAGCNTWNVSCTPFQHGTHCIAVEVDGTAAVNEFEVQVVSTLIRLPIIYSRSSTVPIGQISKANTEPFTSEIAVAPRPTGRVRKFPRSLSYGPPDQQQ